MLANKFNYKQINHQAIKKRHWLIASCLVVTCSWITHTTTASIRDNLPEEYSLSLVSDIQTTGQYSVAGKLSSFEKKSKSTLIEELGISPSIKFNEFTNKLIHQQNSFIDFNDKASEAFKLVTHKVKKGETLGQIFNKLDLDSSLPYKISKNEMGRELVSSLSIGKEIAFKFDQSDNLKQLNYPVSSLQKLVINIDDYEIKNAQVVDLPYQKKQHDISGEIHSSLYEAALEAGLSNSLVMEMVKIFGWDIDFVLDIRKGDSFHIIYDTYELNGEKLTDGNILAAEFTTQGQRYRAIRFTDPEGGTSSYYTPEGKSMLGTFLRSPVEFSRISSRFGKRKHPILKTWRAHKGVDYAASRGTPIRATADGKIVSAGKKGGYGNAVVLRHAGQFGTLYAHMSRFAKGIRSGNRVKQGDVIGYIGSTGLATGPHLHYEFQVNGVHRNPLTYKTPKASSIKKQYRSEFNQLASNWQSKLENLNMIYLAKIGNTETNIKKSTL